MHEWLIRDKSLELDSHVNRLTMFIFYTWTQLSM